MYTPVTWVSDLWLPVAFVTKGFFVSFLLNDLLMASILTSLFSFTFLVFFLFVCLFADVPLVVLVVLDFLVFVDD